MDGQVPVGFCQYYDCYDANGMEDWFEVDAGGETFSIDYMIGDEAYLGKGYGKAMVGLLSGTVRDSKSAKRIIVQPEPENTASAGVLLANGYTYDEKGKYYCKLLDKP
jgi:RimJ/RimL family protein N-acetyltransferase